MCQQEAKTRPIGAHFKGWPCTDERNHTWAHSALIPASAAGCSCTCGALRSSDTANGMKGGGSAGDTGSLLDVYVTPSHTLTLPVSS